MNIWSSTESVSRPTDMSMMPAPVHSSMINLALARRIAAMMVSPKS